MPANFGEIASYHNRLAAQYLALARTAHKEGDLSLADYNTQMAARYIEAAEEQRTAMSELPGRPAAQPAPRPWIPAPKRAPLATACLSAIRRGAGSIAAALQHSISRRSASIQSLSLH